MNCKPTYIINEGNNTDAILGGNGAKLRLHKGEGSVLGCEGWKQKTKVNILSGDFYERCGKIAIVKLTVHANGKTEIIPVCFWCWEKTKMSGIEIVGFEDIVIGGE